ncbi:CubicO group peptidase (beta-lactamase class C family) [Saonia flava]|uniref:CubicO group peptidase (Beta-lactamase class C family) n=1 Tax=Saonia flava TaxID=523696 RepID=A0A846QUG7_9FLAO|nr:serine hydrolase domain-containing protein [Saonia flava]NJB70600.1 CubicO group peptidase (beta-lactamase class C family) [Saonia flava]
MKVQIIFLVSLFSITLISCSKDKDNDPEPSPEVKAMYFPKINSSDWETISVEELDWNPDAEQPLYDFLEDHNTDAFVVLKDGRIVLEKYFGDFDASKSHTWNSAAKTLTAFTIGIAQEEGLLSIDNPSSDYMGEGWSSLTLEQEQLITVKHHLTMTSGLDYTDDIFCTDKECLLYKNDPGTYWYYHNAPYTLLDEVISGAVGKDYKTYFYEKVRDRIGMQGSWLKIGYNNLYFSTARSMARFGLLNLNKGIWDGTSILTDESIFNQMTNTSQDLNTSYGYLWWLNGKNSYKVPGSEELFTGKLIPSAPDDLIAGLGAFDQKLYVVPSKGLVVVRMGDSADAEQLGPSSFDNNLWLKLNDLIE